MQKFSLNFHLHACRFDFAKGEFIAAQIDLYGVAERRLFAQHHVCTRSYAHVEQSAADGAAGNAAGSAAVNGQAENAENAAAHAPPEEGEPPEGSFEGNESGKR